MDTFCGSAVDAWLSLTRNGDLLLGDPSSDEVLGWGEILPFLGAHRGPNFCFDPDPVDLLLDADDGRGEDFPLLDRADMSADRFGSTTSFGCGAILALADAISGSKVEVK